MRRLASLVLIAFLLSSCAALVGGGAATRSDVAALEQGMTKQQVKERVGTPWDINVTSTPRGRREQWVYKQAYTQADYLYVYFENGVVTTTQY